MRRHRRKQQTPGAMPARSEQEVEIRRRLDTLRDTTAREVMTPRMDVVALELPVSYEAVSAAVRRSGHSHFPVYEVDLDKLVGVLYVKDVFHLIPPARAETDPPCSVPTPSEVSRRLRQPYVVPETRPVLELLAEMRKARRSFAVVVDEYGGVSGVLTINDLVGELVGDLQDEYDYTAPPEIERVDQSRWLVAGSKSVDDLRDEIGVPIPDGDYVTLGGYLFDLFGRIPEEGETVEREGWRYRVEAMDRRRIDKVVVRAPATTMTEKKEE